MGDPRLFIFTVEVPDLASPIASKYKRKKMDSEKTYAPRVELEGAAVPPTVKLQSVTPMFRSLAQLWRYVLQTSVKRGRTDGRGRDRLQPICAHSQ